MLLGEPMPNWEIPGLEVSITLGWTATRWAHSCTWDAYLKWATWRAESITGVQSSISDSFEAHRLTEIYYRKAVRQRIPSSGTFCQGAGEKERRGDLLAALAMKGGELA